MKELGGFEKAAASEEVVVTATVTWSFMKAVD